MKAYCVFHHWTGKTLDFTYESGNDLEKIFSTKEKAEKYIDDLENHKNDDCLDDEDEDSLDWYYLEYNEEYTIEIWEVD